MEQIPIPEYDAIPLENVAPGLVGLRIVFVNVYGLKNPDGSWVLIDGGLPMSASRIHNWAKENFGDRPPSAVLLTHGHFDHVSALPDLLKLWDVPVYAHPLEMPYITGQQEYPKPDPSVGGGLMSIMSPFLSRGPIDLGRNAEPFSGNGIIAEAPGWRWIHTPGHTRGHVSFFRDQDRALLIGDAFCTTAAEGFYTAAVSQPTELSGPPAYFTPDWDQARNSVQLLAGLKPGVLAPGHGKPVAGSDVQSALETLARNFDEIARPAHK